VLKHIQIFLMRISVSISIAHQLIDISKLSVCHFHYIMHIKKLFNKNCTNCNLIQQQLFKLTMCSTLCYYLSNITEVEAATTLFVCHGRTRPFCCSYPCLYLLLPPDTYFGATYGGSQTYSTKTKVTAILWDTPTSNLLTSSQTTTSDAASGTHLNRQ